MMATFFSLSPHHFFEYFILFFFFHYSFVLPIYLNINKNSALAFSDPFLFFFFTTIYRETGKAACF